VWGENPEALIGSTLVFPAGRLEPVEGGFRFSGRWPYASGVDASDWIMLGAMLQPEGAAKPAPRIVTVRVSDIEVIDTWHVAGLAGTGSKDVACDGLFVPAHMVFDPFEAREGFAPNALSLAGDAYRLPLFPFIPHLVAGPIVGIACGAYEDFIEKLQSQTSVYNRSRLADHTTIQMKVAEAGVLIDTARMLLRENFREAHAQVAAGQRSSVLDRARWRRDATHAAAVSVRAIDLLYGVSGATANYLDNDLQRRFRDAHAAAAQIHLSWDINAPEFGRVAIGAAPANPML
jgi:3-hydroxy-9,10-secoandrosta-1,3,5(10)-triene-9,17-dione monooxygenase